ncbi:hypothetical protein, variant [Verruconis gallopava]|uniref:BTB domain-containing protein n=1 Tax=Verruconis gallopava TaxID=253628 RepID=A0A0D1YVG0_9PEZI|nr:uncharacterized protein PV09_04417 [Verruconis gallopava]XP_016214551.1 hypothetical protein, variant [Verruconis gallopava]KIW04681.1 hypothetical protein PV09_04417 [Verruconis gallopava]KIW04682.1 hypothetical protein, variant [Verruconis gallopava]
MDNITVEPSGVDLMNALNTLYENRKSSDLTVYCRGRTYPVHRAVLSSRSDFFDGACRNPFKESQQGWIDLSEDDPEAVQHMINYFYTLDYLPAPRSRPSRGWSIGTENQSTPSLSSTPSSYFSPAPSSPATPTFPREQQRRLNLSMVEDPLLAIAAEVAAKPASASPMLSRFGVHSPLVPSSEMAYLLAVKEPVHPITPMDTMIREELLSKAFDEEELVHDQSTDYHNAHLVVHAKVYAIAEQYGIKGLKTLAKKKYAAQVTHHRESREFAASLPEIYDGTIETDRGLRDIVIATFRRFPELAQRRDVQIVIKDTPGLAWELFRLAWGLPV